MEQAAEAAGDCTAKAVERREIRDMIKQAISKREGGNRQALEDLLDKLDRGNISDDSAREVLKSYRRSGQRRPHP